MSRTSRVTAQTLKGFQDHLPEEAIIRNDVIARIRAVFESYGFSPVDTPALEHLNTLIGAGGEETNKQLFRLQSPEDEPIALRFDLTVPFARLLAQYPEALKPPARRYHIGPVWRADKPGPGRFRQFTQMDVDAAGSTSMAVDAEIISVACDAMQAVGFPDFRILINNRRLVDALLEDCGISDGETQKHVLRVIDKLAKVGVDNVILELGPGRIDDSGDPIRGVGLAPEIIDRIVAFVSLQASSREAMVEALAALLPATDGARKALDQMTQLADSLAGLGISQDNAVFDPSLARGLDYYTGPVFETILPQAPEFGSVGAGGRYDGLVERFLPTPIPATGYSVGLDRLLAALKHLGIVHPRKTATQVLIVTMRHVADRDYLALARELRQAGLSAEIYFGRRKDGMTQQLSYANRKGIPVAVIMGGDELADQKVSIKDLQEGREAREGLEDRDAYLQAGKAGQRTIDRADMVAEIGRILTFS